MVMRKAPFTGGGAVVIPKSEERIKQLESELGDVYKALKSKIDENARLRKALEKYADPERHSMDETGFVWSGDYFDYETARKALEGK